MKFTGAVLLWTAFILTGIKVSSLLKKRVAVMDETILFLSSLESEILFSKSDIIKILSRISYEGTMKSLTYLDSFSDLPPESNFHNVWRESIGQFGLYKTQEKEKMRQLGSFLGTTDVENQISTIKLYMSFFERFRLAAVAENEKYGKVSSLFGMFLGASVFILLL